MDSHEAQAALDDIQRLQGQAREEHLRRTYSPKAVVGSAVALFAVYASFDLPGDHWPALAALASIVALGGWALACRSRVAVRRRPTGREAAFYGLVAIGYVGVWLALVAVAKAVDVPAPNTTAAAGMALASVAAARELRRAHTALLAGESGGR